MSQSRAVMQKIHEPATNVGQFLAKRGRLVMKEFREFRKVECDYGSTLTITTLILSVAHGRNAERTFGLKLEHDNDGREESCFLDFDELVELLHAIKFIFSTAREIIGQKRDYTEFEYSTKESMRVGFYQSKPSDQRAFVDVAPGGSMMFVSFEQLRQVFNGIKAAREHLITCGAGTGSQDELSPAAG
jgi:hypothetical protein